LYARGELNARERGLADLLRARGFHVLLPDSFTPRGLRELCTTPLAQRTLRAAGRRADIQDALDWLAARPDVDRTRIVVIGWSHGGSAVLAACNRCRRARRLPFIPVAALMRAPKALTFRSRRSSS